MPKASGCHVDICAGVHEPDGAYHAAELELYPLSDGTTLVLSISLDERVDPANIRIEFKLIAEPGVDRTIGADVLRGIWDANHERWERRGYAPVANIPAR